MSPTPFIPDIYMEEESDDYSEDSDGSNESDAILVVLPLPPVRPFFPTLLDCWMAEIRDFDFIWCLQAFVVYLSVSWLLNLLAGTYRPPNSEYFEAFSNHCDEDILNVSAGSAADIFGRKEAVCKI